MALTNQINLIKTLHTSFPRGSPIHHRELSKLGVSSALAHYYVKSGWLTRLGRGVFMFPGDTLNREGCLKFLSHQLRDFHIGGKSALGLRGIRHNLPFNEALSLWGSSKFTLPSWFQARFPSRYTAQHLFSAGLPKQFGLQPLPESQDGVLVSVPEKALLEMLSEVGLHEGIEEARNVMEGARTLRPEFLTILLKHCQRIKVVRLCVNWGLELGLPWAESVRKTSGNQSSGRWISRFKDGSLLILKANG